MRPTIYHLGRVDAFTQAANLARLAGQKWLADSYLELAKDAAETIRQIKEQAPSLCAKGKDE
jgi:hypothetical protein